uniref:Transmembrane protein n=1 Tax=Fagus sylvatica TaxID=28930 RepID=A0A2N9GCD2_FAGSY
MEIQSFQQTEDRLKAIIEEKEKSLDNIKSSARNFGSLYVVFQGVILTVVCNGSQSLKPSNRWFLFTLSILASLASLFAFINIGNDYNRNKAEQYNMASKRDRVYQRLHDYEEGLQPNESCNYFEEFRDINQERKRKIYLALSIIFLLGFDAIALVGCWIFVGNQKEEGCTLPSNDKCIRLCNGAKCITICGEY